MVAQVNYQGEKHMQTLSQEPGETRSNIDWPISDAAFLEMCRQDETFRAMILKIFDQLEAEGAKSALSLDGNRRSDAEACL